MLGKLSLVLRRNPLLSAPKSRHSLGFVTVNEIANKNNCASVLLVTTAFPTKCDHDLNAQKSL